MEGVAGAGAATGGGLSASGGSIAPAGSTSQVGFSQAATGASSGPDQTGATGSHTIQVGEAIPPTGQGWDAHHVYVGITTASDASAGLHAIGVSLDPGNEIGDAQAVVADLNRRGGIFGRQVVLIDKDDKSANVLADPGAAGQADCLYFTQDHPVIDVVNTDALVDTDTFRSCLARAHTPLVTVTTSAFDDQTTASLSPYFYNALSVSWSHLTPLLVTQLAEMGYFHGWNTTTGSASVGLNTKVGVLYGTDSAGNRDGPALIAALRRAGYATDAFQYNQDSDAPSAVLRFEQDRVTHVIGVDNFQFFFMTAARSQDYLPRYGITTYNGPQALLESNGNAAQLAGALGIGWYPTLDTDTAQDPGPGPGTRACLSALAAGGQIFSGKRFAEAVGLAICDGIDLGVFGARAGQGLSATAIRAGIVRLGTDFPTGGAFTSGLSATNFALPGAGRDLGWDGSCDCFTYLGSAYPI